MRLSNDKREAVLHFETSKRFSKKVSTAKKDYQDELEKEVTKTIPKEVFKYYDLGWIGSHDNVEVQGLDEQLSRYVDLSMSNYLPIKRNSYRHKIKSTKTLEKKIKIFIELEKDEAEFRKILQTSLRSLNTSKQVLEHLPELKEHFKDDSRAKQIIPVEKLKQVRKLLKT